MTGPNASMIHESELDQRERGITEFPEYRIYYFESGTSHEQFKDSTNGRLLIPLRPGESLHYFRIERRGNHNFETAYDCVFKRAGSESDDTSSGKNGASCPSITPLTDSRYIKRFSASLIYTDPSERAFSLAYRGWISASGNPGMKEPDPQAGGYWYVGPGSKCGTAHDKHWITAMELRASPMGA